MAKLGGGAAGDGFVVKGVEAAEPFQLGQAGVASDWLEFVDGDRVDNEGRLGVVVAVGEGRRLDNGQIIPLRIKKGDHVIFSKYGPDEVKVDNEIYLIVSESDILAVIDK